VNYNFLALEYLRQNQLVESLLAREFHLVGKDILTTARRYLVHDVNGADLTLPEHDLCPWLVDGERRENAKAVATSGSEPMATNSASMPFAIFIFLLLREVPFGHDAAIFPWTP